MHGAKSGFCAAGCPSKAWHVLHKLRVQRFPEKHGAEASPYMQEAKSKPVPQQVPQLSQAPSRLRSQLVLEDSQTVQPKATDSSDSTLDRPSGTASAAATLQTVPEPPPQLKQAPPRPRAATVQLPQESASSAAGPNGQPPPDAEPVARTLRKHKQPGAKAFAAGERLQQLEQTRVQPTLEPSGSAPSPEECTCTAAGLDAQPSPQATPEPLPQLNGAPVRPTAQPSRTVQPAEETASIPAGSDSAKTRPQAGVEAALPQLAPAIQAQSTANSIAPEAPRQAESALAASGAPAAAPARTPSVADRDFRRSPKAQGTRSAAARDAPEALPPPQRPLRAMSGAAPGVAAQRPSSAQEAGNDAAASMAQSDAPKLAAPHQDDMPAGSSTSKSANAVETIQQNGVEAAEQLALAPAPEALPKLAKPAAQQPRAAQGAKVRRMAGLHSPEDMASACSFTQSPWREVLRWVWQGAHA